MPDELDNCVDDKIWNVNLTSHLIPDIRPGWFEVIIHIINRQLAGALSK